MHSLYEAFIESEAESETECHRKLVISMAFLPGGVRLTAVNGSRGCSNEIGNCGCTHAEQRLICTLYDLNVPADLAIPVFQRYSPCTSCANLIAASRFNIQLYYLERTQHDLRGIDILGSRCEQYVPPRNGRSAFAP